MTSEILVPVYKAGGVILRAGAAGMEFLAVRPKPKHAGERPKLVLPRGSRQYRDGDQWIDVRDAATASARAADLETLERTVAREMEEEAGLPIDGAVRVVAMGVRVFASSSKPPYPIHWVVVLPDAATLARMQSQPVDAMEPVQWLTLAQAETLAAEGDFSVGYLAVVREALALV